MASSQPLFTVPIEACDAHPGGSITCTEPSPNVYLLTFVSPPDNRLVSPFCAAMLKALDIIEFGHAPGVVVTTSGIPKFYSNGLDLDHARSTAGYWDTRLWALFRRFLTYPMPTVALINGHGFAGGLMLSMHHDYRVMNPSRGFVCLNELEFGAPLKPPMSAVFRLKCSPAAYRALVLEARRFGGVAALEAGIVDAVGGLEVVLGLVGERGLTEKGKTGVYGLLKMEMYRESLDLLENHLREERKDDGWFAEEDKRQELGRTQVEVWKGKAKL